MQQQDDSEDEDGGQDQAAAASQVGPEHDYFSLAPWSQRAGATVNWLAPSLLLHGWWGRRTREQSYVERSFRSTQVAERLQGREAYTGTIEDGEPRQRPSTPPSTTLTLLYTPISLPRHSVHPWAGAVEPTSAEVVRLAEQLLAAYLPCFTITVRTEVSTSAATSFLRTTPASPC